jgi:Concanavalin A-like lectin/glucanases superfamily
VIDAGRPRRWGLSAAVAAAAGLAAMGCTAAPIDVARLLPGGIASDLQAHWSFDDGAGTVLTDDSGNRRDGAITGATWRAGRFGGALQFQPGDQVTVAQFPDATTSWSVSVWVNMPADQQLGNDYITLVSTEISGIGGWEMNLVPTPGDMRYQFGYFVGPTISDHDFIECTACFQADTWTHIVAVIDGAAAALTLYVNGRRAGPVTTDRAVSQGSSTLYMATWSQQPPPAPTRFLTGALDDIAIWSRALVPEEVAYLTDHPAPDR